MNFRKSWMPLLLLFISSFIFSKTAVYTGAQPASLEREPLPIANYMLLPHPELEIPLEQQSLPDLPEGDPPIDNIGLWSRMVFQSYRDGVWNIYSNKHYGAELRQLTNEAAHNIHPDFNRGTSQIVFASQGPNSFAIHRMNSDGSNRVALTSSPGDDVYPRWSPDGNKIAFESYRDGQAEIYVMNADGSQLQRLTHSPGFDGMPTWSPDGTKIAFVSQRSGVLRIWVMNADGSNPVQISQTPSSAFPAWSPDGTKIAYSADSNQDGWLEVWVMNADGTNAQHLVSPFDNQDLWVRGWSPDSQYITYTRINFVQQYGFWFWTDAEFEIIDPANSWANFPLFSHHLDWYPHWQTSDAIAPIVSLHNYPQYASPQPLLTWEGTDVGSAGFLNFDVQYRSASSGQWQDWLMGTPDTEANLTAPLGDEYIFRIRGRDRAYNVSNWKVSSSPLTLYAWTLQGRMTDNAGVPVMGATIEATPTPFLLRETDNSGQFALYVDQVLSTYQANWHKPGYGSLPTSHYDGGQTEAQTHVVLPPTDDLVENGDFESGGLGPHWQASGEYMPEVTNAAFNTGQYAAGLGNEMLDVELSPWFTLSDSSGMHHQLLAAPNGEVYIAWAQGWGQERSVYFRERSVAGIWAEPVQISDNTGPINLLQMMLDDNGNIHIAWQQQTDYVDDVYYNYRPSDGEWDGPINLSAFATSSIWTFGMVMTSNGHLHIVLPLYAGHAAYNLYYRERDLAGNWSSASSVANGVPFNELMLKSQNNTLHLISAMGTEPSNSWYWQKPSGEVWSSPQNIPIVYGLSNYEFVLTPNGHLHLLSWRTGGPEIYHTRRSPNGQWTQPYLVTYQNTQHFFLEALTTADNALHLIWQVNVNSSYSPENGLYYAKRSSNNSWTGPNRLSSDRFPYARLFGADEAGNIHLLYETYPHDLYYYLVSSPEGVWSSPYVAYDDATHLFGELALDGVAHLLARETGSWRYATLSSSSGESMLAQTIPIPAEMTDPYLSFVYRMAGASPALNTGLTIKLSTEDETVVLAQIQENVSDWTQVSLPLADWAGETITLTWDVPQPVLAIPVSVWLDDVTVGSAHPDVWLAPLPRQTALPGEIVSYPLVYGNQGGAAARATTVTLQLPSDLLFVSATPTPIINGASLTWELGDLPPLSPAGTIDLTLLVAEQATLLTTLSTTAVIGTLDLELEMLNNERPLLIFVGREQYLPLIAR